MRPDPIRTDQTNAFAHDTIARRAPAIVRQIIRRNPDYDPTIAVALERLAVDLETGAPVTLFAPPAPDYDEWAGWFARRGGETWDALQWWWAEVYFYRQIMAAVRWWETGRDPFAALKTEALDASALWEAVEGAARIAMMRLAPGAQLSRLLLLDLWGNRMDMSHHAAEHGLADSPDDLLIDQRQAAVTTWEQAAAPRQAHLIADNTGAELALDFVLIDHLLGNANAVTLHLKLHPTFVSDATAADASLMLARIESAQGMATRQLGERLRAAFAQGRLRFAPDPFWNSPLFAWEMPPRLRAVFEGSALVIVKGDANYRRFVGDALFTPATAFETCIDYMPAPLLALRSLKSDSVLAITAEQTAALNLADTAWRTNGKRGVIQFTR